MKPSTVSARAKDRPSKAWGFYLAMVTLFSFLTLFYLWHHIDVLRAGYRIEELKREITKRRADSAAPGPQARAHASGKG